MFVGLLHHVPMGGKAMTPGAVAAACVDDMVKPSPATTNTAAVIPSGFKSLFILSSPLSTNRRLPSVPTLI
jgi:hypothetical protein